MGIQLLGSGKALPQKCVTNDDLSLVLDTSDEWIRSRSGICTRYISEGETTSDLGSRAADEAIKNAGLVPEDIDCIITATFTPENFTPSCSCLIQEKLGLKEVPLMAFDVNAACSGFMYALNVASALLAVGQIKCACVIGAETISNVLDWTDRSTCVLFGDGAGAVVVKADPDKEMAFYAAAKGDSSGNLETKALPVHKKVTMEGNAVFRFATKAMTDAVSQVLKKSNHTIDDIDWIVPHQANIRIIDYVTKKSKIDSAKVYTNLDRYGNTSAASIPIALAEMMADGKLKAGMKIVLAGFGAGFTWAGALLEI
ncbi:MAG: beta-ketoacyl-ACP synthase III [Eubacterium sp.]